MAGLDEGLLRCLYASVEQEDQWIALMDGMKERLGVRSAVVQVLSSAGPGPLREIWTARDTRSQCEAHVHDRWLNSPANPRFRRPAAMPPLPPRISSDHRLFRDNETDRSVLREGLAQGGLGPAFWLGFPLGPDSHFCMIFHRAPEDDRDVDAEQEGLLGAFIPHLQQAVGLWKRMGDTTRHTRALEQACLGLDMAMLMCDRALNVLWANGPAQALVARSPHMQLRGGTLWGARPGDTARLRALVERGGETGEDVLALGAWGEDMLHVRALPADGPADGAQGDQVMLLLTAPERPAHVSVPDLARLFGLTAAEAHLAATLGAGRSVSDFAALRGITLGTARIQLKRVLAKTGTSRQADLVRLVCASVCARTPLPA